ncbi:MAG: adenosylcobinamide-phosphate synthase CbiB [archaeon]|nr:adenosylcobinamide-phosphate synthase CbiB [archaeon]
MEIWMDALVIVILTFLIDRYLGDPSNTYHPLRWMGNFLDAIDRRIIDRKSWKTAVMGFVGYAAVLIVFGGIAMLITTLVRFGLGDIGTFSVAGVDCSVGEIVWLFVTAYLFKICYALFAFRKFCKPIEEDLVNGDLEAAADKTQMMVNRKMKGMDLPHITSSCCETISENLVDSVVSPLFYFGLFGLPGAIMFRCANLMDAMWGHKDERRFVLGHFPAIWDDVLGFVPSRISPVFVAFAGRLMRIKGYRSAIKASIKEHRKTPSPNSGWPMTAVAAAMGNSFEKEGVYVMGEGPLPEISDIPKCYHLVELTSILFLMVVCFPLAAVIGLNVQMCFEEFIHGILGGF